MFLRSKRHPSPTPCSLGTPPPAGTSGWWGLQWEAVLPQSPTRWECSSRVTKATETSICPSWRCESEDRRHGKRFHISPDNTASALR